MSENCYNCSKCSLVNENYSCSHKKCNMGKTPYYPESIPENRIYSSFDKTIRVCLFNKREKPLEKVKKQKDLSSFLG